MAILTDKWPGNIAGKYYVDQQCIDCDEGGYSIVYKQPTTDKEVQECEEAREGCPVEAIGNDGV